jgi:hypothetical protein
MNATRRVRGLNTGTPSEGSAVLILMILLGIVLVFLAGRMADLRHLKEEIRRIEQIQLDRHPEFVRPDSTDTSIRSL